MNSKQDIGIPKIYFCGTDFGYNLMVIELLGKSLETLFKENNRKFSLKTILMLAEQMLERVKFLHSKNFIHRDLKPDNFIIGNEKCPSRVYMIDFGLSKQYI